MKNKLAQVYILGALSMLLQGEVMAQDNELFSMNLPSGESLDIRQYEAEGEKLMLGFVSDQGTGNAEINTASLLSENDMEIWMSELLAAYFLPKQKSAIEQIPTQDAVAIIDAAFQNPDERVYLIPLVGLIPAPWGEVFNSTLYIPRQLAAGLLIFQVSEVVRFYCVV